MKYLYQIWLIAGTLITISYAASMSTADTPLPSTYKPRSHAPTLITNATVLTATWQRLEVASLYLVNGKIVSVGELLTGLSAETHIIDTEGAGYPAV